MTNKKQYTIKKTNNEYYVYNSDSTLTRIYKTKQEAKEFIKKRIKGQKESKPSSIFNQKAIRELNKIALEK